ncbi:MAG TPA: serpin family protein, partial [Polyangiaceae bacterium]|nr:serpin family protein [Polyangiaceae bacterium]
HLKFPWKAAFAPTATAAAPFTTTDGSMVSPNVMHQESTFAYVDDGQAQIVALPLAGGELTVLVALPHGDLATYEAALSAGSAALTVPARSADVVLSLPKFDFTSPSFSLGDALKAMKMTDAFDKSLADFTPMCPNPPDGARLFVSDVIQKATLAVQETGVEAAAATAVILGGTDAILEPTPMVVNRPFVVSIVDAPTGALLFLGHIDDPTVGGSP